MKNSTQRSFQSILKSTVIFGSTQVFQMMIMLLRSKVSAVLLGPFGMGMYSIFQNTMLTVSQFSSCGIFNSGVKEISQYNKAGDESKLSEKVKVFSTISHVFSLLSLFIMIILSFPLSYFSFGNSNHVLSFVFLSLGALFYLLAQKQLTIMQATRQIKNIALCSLISAASSLLIAVVMYLLFDIKGIVPAIILSFFFQFVINYSFTRKIKYEGDILSIKDCFKQGKSLLSLGFVLMLSVLLINLFTLILNALISNYGKIDDLGLFYAAFTITNGNILILFSVLSSDYFPRLSSDINNKKEVTLIVNQQSELMSIITAPIIILLILFSSIIVKLLLSNDFLIIIPMLKLMSIGLLFRIIWQSLSYVILSSGDKKTYFIFDALLGNGLVFISNVIFYFKFGLIGLGYSFVISSIIVALLLIYVVKTRYNIKLEKKFLISFLISLLLCFMSYVLSMFNVSIVFSLIILFVSIFFSLYIISNRIDIDLALKIKNLIKKH